MNVAHHKRSTNKRTKCLLSGAFYNQESKECYKIEDQIYPLTNDSTKRPKHTSLND